jgi:hypothetical protein
METLEERPLREWATPTFECVPLNKALWESGPTTDGGGTGSFTSGS